MVAAISGADDSDRASALISRDNGSREPLRLNRIVVIGGGCYGSWYTQQLARSSQRGALEVGEVIVVDRNPACIVASRREQLVSDGLPVRVAHTTWSAFLEQWLAEGDVALRGDTMVPSPLMPHLCLDWLMARARARWPSRTVDVKPLPSPPHMPWERAAPDGRHYVSYATWTCPVNCIEPSRCPATKGERDWSMPRALAGYVEADRSTPPLRGPVIFHCVHRTYGVGMIDASVIARADDNVAEWGASGPTSVLVGTVSHCHGALGVLSVA